MSNSKRGLLVSEVFNNTIQGEGPRAGRACSFIRLGGCNLSCDFCDSSYSWDATKFDMSVELTKMTPEEIMDMLSCDVREVVITGGEPMMHQRNESWDELLRLLKRKGIFIAIETNGTFTPTPTTETFVDHYSVSPKLPSAGSHRKGQSAKMALWPANIRNQSAILKFVVYDTEDVTQSVAVADEAGWQRDRVWVMPEGVTTEVLLARWPDVVQAAIAHGVNATQRLHVLAFGDTRGT